MATPVVNYAAAAAMAPQPTQPTAVQNAQAQQQKQQQQAPQKQPQQQQSTGGAEGNNWKDSVQAPARDGRLKTTVSLCGVRNFAPVLVVLCPCGCFPVMDAAFPSYVDATLP